MLETGLDYVSTCACAHVLTYERNKRKGNSVILPGRTKSVLKCLYLRNFILLILFILCDCWVLCYSRTLIEPSNPHHHLMKGIFVHNPFSADTYIFGNLPEKLQIYTNLLPQLDTLLFWAVFRKSILSTHTLLFRITWIVILKYLTSIIKVTWKYIKKIISLQIAISLRSHSNRS